MGFETQEEAERWAENMEFLADKRKEERMLMSDGERAIEEFRYEMEKVLPASHIDLMHKVCNMAKAACRAADAGKLAVDLINTLNGPRPENRKA